MYFPCELISSIILHWHHNERDGVSNHRRLYRLPDQWPVDSPHKGAVTRNAYPFEDVIMDQSIPIIRGRQCGKLLHVITSSRYVGSIHEHYLSRRQVFFLLWDQDSNPAVSGIHSLDPSLFFTFPQTLNGWHRSYQPPGYTALTRKLDMIISLINPKEML